MKKKRMIIIVILSFIVILSCVGIFLWKLDQNKSILLDTFLIHFEHLSKEDQNIYPLKKYIKVKNKGRYVYQFREDFDMIVSYNPNKKIEKVYYYVKNDKNNLKEMKYYLEILVKAMNFRLSDKEVDKIVSELTDITGKKADEFGFLTEFKQDGYSYMALEKNDGKYLSFFIYPSAT